MPRQAITPEHHDAHLSATHAIARTALKQLHELLKIQKAQTQLQWDLCTTWDNLRYETGCAVRANRPYGWRDHIVPAFRGA